MMHLFVYPSLPQPLRDYLKGSLPSGITTVYRDEFSDWDAIKILQNSDLLFGNPPAKWLSDHAPAKLLFWQIDSAGFDQFSQVKTNATVANMGDFYAQPCAETVVAGILAFYRKLPELIKAKDNRDWIGKTVRPQLEILGRKKVMILGAGAIGLMVKQILQGFGCTITLTARTNPAADIHTYEDLLEALPDNDVIVNTLPGSADNFVSAAFLESMKKGSLYASVGRGNTTDEPALIQQIVAGKLVGAVLDVTEKEPLPEESPLWNMENVILTQHSGGGQANEEAAKVDIFLKNLRHFLEGAKPKTQIKLEKGY